MQFDSQSLWMYLHFPNLQLNVMESRQKQTTEKPIPRAIYQSTTNELVQVNNAASKEGVNPGMGLAKASLLYQDLQLHEYSASAEQNALEHIAQQLYLITSDIAIEAPKGIILRVQNMLHMYGSLNSYWRVIEYCLKQYEFQCYAATGYSIQVAKLIATQHKQLISDERLDINQCVDTCRLNTSDMDPKDIDKLLRIGVKTVADIKRLPIEELAGRINKYSMKVVNEIRGIAPATVSFYQPSTEFHDFIELLYEIDNTDKITHVLITCLRKLEQFLYVRNARSLSISVELLQREHAPLVFDVHSATPIYRAQSWQEIIALRLERLQLQSPVYGVELHCIRYEITPVSNDDMFAKKSHHVEGLSLMSRLVSKLGDQKVQQLSYSGDVRPERISNYTSLNHKQKTSSLTTYADRPGILLPLPQPLHKKVTVLKGPERILSGWFDEHEVQRDYFVAQDDNGQQVWIFKNADEQWYLHGFFI